MKLLAVLAIWLTCTVVFQLGRVISPLPTQNYVVNQFPSVSLALTYTEDDKAAYQQFLVDLRNNLALGGTISHGIPVLSKKDPKVPKYLLVNIQNSHGNEITFGLNVSNAYVVAYKVGDNSYFFNDKVEKDPAMKYLFTNTRQVVHTALSGNYEDFKKQGADRSKTDIGIGALSGYIETLYYNTLPGKIAKPLVCIIQMVSEAARFKYIGEKIIEKDYKGSFIPGVDITTRENSWDPLSDGVQYADKDGYLQAVDKKGKLKRTKVELPDKTVEKVDQIDYEMALLKYAWPVKKGYNILESKEFLRYFLGKPSAILSFSISLFLLISSLLFFFFSKKKNKTL